MARTHFSNASNAKQSILNLEVFLPKKRMCNQPHCLGRMRPTRMFYPLSHKHRIFRCCDCGHENPWLDDPFLDGSHGELHKFKNEEGHSGLSMLSDPVFYPPKRKKRT